MSEPVATPRQCSHCANPDVGDWIDSCQYKGMFSTQDEFLASTFDPPCALEAYDRSQQELAESNRRRWLGGVVLASAAGMLLWLLILAAIVGIRALIYGHW